MKKNGFIATSILYSFFLVFITLFVSLVANYIHNQVLIRRQNEESREKLMSINNMDISKIKFGEYVKFQTNPIKLTIPPVHSDYEWESAGEIRSYLRETNWIYAYRNNQPNYTDYYFISDTNIIQGTTLFVKMDGTQSLPSPLKDSINYVDKVIKKEYDGYNLMNLSLAMNKSYPGDFDADPVTFEIDFLKASTLQSIKERAKNYMKNPSAENDKTVQYNFAVNKNIFYAFGGYIVKYDLTDKRIHDIDGKRYYTENDTDDPACSPLACHSGYYYISSQNDVSNRINGNTGLFRTLCGSTSNPNNLEPYDFGGTIDAANDVDNPLVFVGLEGETNSGIIGDKYDAKIDYCNYASASAETKATTGSIGIRLQMVIRVKKVSNAEPVHIDSGRGSENDPYYIRSGKKH